MNKISLLLAFSAGLLSFLSPCVLPLVPAYITYLTGSTVAELQEKKLKLYTLYKAAGFVIGFSLVFIIMGISISSMGKFLIRNQLLFRKAGGILIILFGIHTTGLIKIKTLYREKRLLPFEKLNKGLSSVLIGMAFAAGWTPCVGPILSSILIYAGSLDTVVKGIALLTAYSAGLAVPFLLTAFALGSFSHYFRRISKHLGTISVISGLLLIVMGILVYSNRLASLGSLLNSTGF